MSNSENLKLQQNLIFPKKKEDFEMPVSCAKSRGFFSCFIKAYQISKIYSTMSKKSQSTSRMPLKVFIHLILLYFFFLKTALTEIPLPQRIVSYRAMVAFLIMLFTHLAAMRTRSKFLSTIDIFLRREQYLHFLGVEAYILGMLSFSKIHFLVNLFIYSAFYVTYI